MLINTRYVILYDLNLRIVTQVKYYRYYPYLIEKARTVSDRMIEYLVNAQLNT